MARLTPLGMCLELHDGVVLDTSVLISLFGEEQRTGIPSPLLARIPPTRRYTSAVARGEFLCNISNALAVEHAKWLDEKRIRVLPLTQAVTHSFSNLARPPVACGSLNDLLIAATAMAGNFALAAEDHDFDRLGQLTTVVEFARS